jgi:membrane fusion protein (multidrug efflux system)
MSGIRERTASGRETAARVASLDPPARAAVPMVVPTRNASDPATAATAHGTAPPIAPAPAVGTAQAPGAALTPTPAPRTQLASDVTREIFQLARRVALQADLAAAVRVLQHGVARLTDSRDAMCILDPASVPASAPEPAPPAPGPAPPAPKPTAPAPVPAAGNALDGELRALAAQVARTGDRAATGRALAEPIGPPPARSVLVARRSDDQVPYATADAEVLAAIARAVAGLVGHFAVEHDTRREQAARDARLPFRIEALTAHRGAVATPGRRVASPRTWMRWAYPMLIGLVAILVAAAAIIQVPTYSTGAAVVTVDGAQVTSSSPGTVAELLVAPGARVAPGDPVLRLHAADEETELAASEADYRGALSTFLASPGDDGARGALAAITTRRQRARAVVNARTLRAPAAGIVGDIRVRPGQLVTPGAPVMKIAPTADLAVVAVLPGIDRPRLAAGMTLQIELAGYHARREQAVIDSIGIQVIGPDEARRSLGAQIGDALPISGPVVLVRGHLPARTFEAGGREYAFYDGMVGKAEVRVDSDRLLRLLLPGKRK